MIKRFGDIATVLTLLPLLIVMAVLVGLYYMVRFPLWWIHRVWRTKKNWLKWRDIDIV
jgi:hypothetical protein